MWDFCNLLFVSALRSRSGIAGGGLCEGWRDAGEIARGMGAKFERSGRRRFESGVEISAASLFRTPLQYSSNRLAQPSQ